MATQTTNVGLVKAIFVGSTAPSNIDVIWKDTTVGLHKVYNSSTSTWETLVGFVLIDNSTIKRDINGNLYVDPSVLPALSVANGSITLIKMADVPTGTVFYRKSAGDGPPEVQTLAQLKADLGLSGDNTGDQDLGLYALKTYTINTKPLSGNIVLTPADIGSPAGSGTSTGTNTGDETELSILAKLGTVSGIYSIDEIDALLLGYQPTELGKGLSTEDFTTEEKDKLADLKRNLYQINMPSGSLVTKIAGATFLPIGWATIAQTGDYNATITHTLTGRKIGFVNVFEIDGGERLLSFDKGTAYTGIVGNVATVLIEGLAPTTLPIRIELIFD